MPIYSATIAGHDTPILMSAGSASKAKDALVSLVALTASEVAEAFTAGKTLWRPGDAITVAAEAKTEAKDENNEDSAKPDGAKGDQKPGKPGAKPE